MRMLASIGVLAVVVACTPPPGEDPPPDLATLPQPVPLENTRKANADAALTRLIGTHPLDTVRDTPPVSDLLAWLEGQFGKPVVPLSTVTITVDNRYDGRPHMVLKADGRQLNLGVIDLLENRRRYVVHELFHALYQSDAFLKRPRSQVEAWATYAELRFASGKLINDQVWAATAPETDDTVEFTCDSYDSFARVVDMAPSEQAAFYRLNARHLFALSHGDARKILARLQRGGEATPYGSAVCTTQQALADLRMLDSAGVTPVVTPEGRAAIRAFQKLHGLKPTGTADTATRDAIADARGAAGL